MNELLWISVPAGSAPDGRFQLRVLVIPRPQGPTLSAAGLDVWPPAGLVGSADLKIDWRASETAPVTTTAVNAADVHFDATAALWQRFWPANLPVGGSVAGALADPAPEVTPTSDHAAKIDQTYSGPTSVAFDNQPDAPVPAAYDDSVRTGLARWASQPTQPTTAALLTGPAPAPAPATFESVFAMLREHPAVLRALGLIYDLVATAPAGLGGAGQLRVSWPSAPAALPVITSPWTMYGDAFLPFSRSGAIARGMVTLTPDLPVAAAAAEWTVVTVDVDGAVRRLGDAAQAVTSAANTDGAAPTMPALRSAGLQLVRINRAAHLQQRMRTTHSATSLDGAVLDADDLVLGYRIDIKRGGGDWRSLHERIATYNRGDPSDVIVAEHHEEGHIKVNAARRDPDGVLRADEIVARWSGWSLAVSRPPFDRANAATSIARTGDTGVPFGWTFQVPDGSLPALRFTDTYAIRARVADVTGGGLQLTDALADRCAISEQFYRRYEPVPSPPMHLDADVATLGPGEAVDRVVVRSAPGVAIGDFGAANPGYAFHPSRTLRQPAAGLAAAEQHNMLTGHDDQETFSWVARALVAASDPQAGGDPSHAPLPDPAAGGVSVLPLPEPGSPPAAFARHDWTPPWPTPDSKIVELRDHNPGEPTVIWEGDTLVVRLPPGRQLAVQLSSSLTPDFQDHFALQETMPQNAKDAAVLGRHPLINPPHQVRFVHAVRKPLTAPDLSTQLSVHPRAEGDSFAALDPSPPLFGLDAESTAQLDLTGTWLERRDDAVDSVTGAAVSSVAIDRGAAALGAPLRHEFGDTRRRDITYTAAAVSRFRQYFTAAETEHHPENFVEQRQLSTVVTIPSSARPPAPVVLATRPAFTWTQTVTGGAQPTLVRQRRGGALRVELARPWYVSGDNERLAVILWDHTGGSAPPAALAGLITEAGRDPIWDTTDPLRWPIDAAFARMADAVTSHTIVEADAAALVLPFEPWFHVDRWYADIGLPGVAASSYCPFVRLALARYQSASIDRHHLSPVVHSDLTQVLPDRELIVTASGVAVAVRLTGTESQSMPRNRVDIVVESSQPGTPRAAGDDGTVALDADPDPGAWRPVPGTARQTTLGAAPVSVPVPSAPGLLRLRIREVEQIGAAPAAQLGSPAELAERVVFTDTVPLPLASG
jgi:hypothetical protein